MNENATATLARKLENAKLLNDYEWSRANSGAVAGWKFALGAVKSGANADALRREADYLDRLQATVDYLEHNPYTAAEAAILREAADLL